MTMPFFAPLGERPVILIVGRPPKGLVGVAVAVRVAVGVNVTVEVAVGVAVALGVKVAVRVTVDVRVAVRLAVRVGINVFVGSRVAVGVTFIPEQPTKRTKHRHATISFFISLTSSWASLRLDRLFYSLLRYAHIIAHQSKYRV
jgi:hypothetical protein